MRIMLVIMTAALVQVSAASLAQQVSLNKKMASLREIFNDIEEQTGYRVIFPTALVKAAGTVSIRLRQEPLASALDKVLAGKGLEYHIVGEEIIVKEKEKSLLDVMLSVGRGKGGSGAETSPQQQIITGRVLDSLGNPLAGATVSVKGHGATFTDRDGRFVLRNVPEDAVLFISYVGYVTKEVKANANLSAIQLASISSELEEVVVNKGYYTTKKELETGSVSHVGAEDIAKSPVTNVLSAVQGRLTGVVISQSTGLPGGAFSVQIRGQNSLANGNNPLYVIDGIPYPDQTLGTLNVTNLKGGSPLNYLNISDIQTFDVLKDADATAIYGSRGANGVILITTKKGIPGATKIDINVQEGIGRVSQRLDLLNTSQYLQMRREAFYNDSIANPAAGIKPAPYHHDVNGDWSKSKYTDWQKVLFGNTAHIHDAHVSFSGGNTNTQFMIGTDYHKESTPVLLGGGDTKGSVHLNLNNSSTNQKFKIGLLTNYQFDENTITSQTPVLTALLLPPNAPDLYNSDGTLNWEPLTPGAAGTFTNPIASFVGSPFNAKTDNLLANLVSSYSIFSGLDLKLTAGYNMLQTKETALLDATKLYDPAYLATSAYSGSQFNTTEIRSWSIEPQLNYTKSFGKGTFSGLLGAAFQEKSSNVQSIQGDGFTSAALLSNIMAASKITALANLNALYKYNAIYSRLNFDWDHKYIVNLTARRDGTSRFGPDKQFANFWSVAGAWVFSNEHFIKQNLDFISSGKLRLSYGTTGNDQIPDYYFMDIYNSIPYTYDGIKGLAPDRLFNASLAWELTKKFEVGLDLGVLNDRINISGDYYRNRSGNQLTSAYPLSSVTGFTGIPSNYPAVIQNSGFEVALNTVNLKGSELTWQTLVNVSMPRNKLISNQFATPDSQFGLKIGYPITIARVFDLAGVNSQTGMFQFRDGNGGLTDNPTKTTILDIAPKFYGGFQNTIRFKNIGLDFLFQFVKQMGLNLWASYPIMPGQMGNQPVSVLNRWQNQGDESRFQQFSQNFSNGYNTWNIATTGPSSFLYEDASFIRLKNLSLSYTFRNQFLNKLNIRNLQMSLQGQNLFTISKYEGLDPESQGTNLPPLKIFTLGIQASF